MKETNLIYKIASLYFEDNLTQQQIAQKMGISRIKVSRMLQQARSNGVVEISLNKPQQNYTEEEKSIASKWNLNEVILSAPEYGSNEDLLKQLGVSASEYAIRILNGNETVSLAWGNTLSAFVQNLPKLDFPEIKIVQMIGGLGSPEAEV
ncbi:MAG: winged helix-turn-helix transcriptional regulator, partial [Spirochaetales bacterium]|nr:winged helix-turn-helix transcriptional regulator [Spirochaetales bacterium]